MFMTPKEAVLQAENDRLRSENEWMKRALEGGGATVTPYGMQSEMAMTRPVDHLQLPRRASICGTRNVDRWEVIASYEMREADKVRIDYFVTETMRAHQDDWSFINNVLPKMHEIFIRQLGDLFVRENKK